MAQQLKTLATCPGLLSIAVIEHREQKHQAGGEVSLPYLSQSEVKAGTQGRNLEVGTEVEVMDEYW